ncbi:prohead protease/major capsid protein fusion protein [Sphingobium sp. WCS2017Hpa-17]|uniref:prohead protease/major capsid protein fusion protein n=1 Tax=Sphingobium sp. WCS2017Hpa-17 TaxID=3073638 RepID=UPI00288AF789|nr:prohead protease/major capsid protein fusion protein [Sphingobium sp. WCS2017Hpa-17]
MPQTAPTRTERRVMAEPRSRDVDLTPGTWNAEARTVEVVWTTGSRGARFDWDSGEAVDEELDTSPNAVRLDRLNSGAPVLDAHRRGSVGTQIGVVLPGSARMQGGRGIATVRLSDRQELASIVSDIGAGIIRNLSVGYTVHAYEVIRQAGQRPIYRAVDWEPFEISFLPVGFDAQAQVRAAPGAAPCTLLYPSNQELSTMPRSSQRNLSGLGGGQHDDNSQADAGVPDAGSIPGVGRIREFVNLAADSGHVSREDCNGIIIDIAERGLNEGQMRDTILQISAARQRASTSGISSIGGTDLIQRWGGGGATYDNPDFHARAIEDAIYARMSGRTPTDHARAFMHMSLVQIAGQVAERAGVRGVQGMAPGDILNNAAWSRSRGLDAGTRSFSVGYHTTSDFPDLLTGAGQRFLMDMFEAAASPLKTLGHKRQARDFRDISGLQLSGFGTLPEVLEAGEIKSDTFKSRKETYRVKTFAKMFSLSRQAIINDDLNAFSNPIRVMSKASAETEASLLADLINNNPVMGDGKALFHADHANLAGTGDLPSIASLSAGRLAMRSQKDLDGITPIAAVPRYILSSPANETVIEQMIATSLNPSQVGETNPFAGKLVPLVDPRLDALPWYLFADPLSAPVIEYAYLEGQEGPRVEMQDGWTTLGTSFRVYMDFGAGLVDHRGGYKNPGAAPG